MQDPIGLRESAELPVGSWWCAPAARRTSRRLVTAQVFAPHGDGTHASTPARTALCRRNEEIMNNAQPDKDVISTRLAVLDG